MAKDGDFLLCNIVYAPRTLLLRKKFCTRCVHNSLKINNSFLHDPQALHRIFDLRPPKQGGYGCHAVIDNSLDKIYRALSWLLAAASAFVCAVGGSALGVFAELPSRHLFCFCQWSGKYPPPLHFTPYTRITNN